MFYMLEESCVIQATVNGWRVRSDEWPNHVSEVNKIKRVPETERLLSYEKSINLTLPPKNGRPHFCDMKILSPQMSSLLTPIEIVSGAAAALWLFLSCKCLAKRSGNLWLVCWWFQMDWWFNSRWLNILSSFCSQGGLRSHCHNSQWFIFFRPNFPSRSSGTVYLSSLKSHLSALKHRRRKRCVERRGNPSLGLERSVFASALLQAFTLSQSNVHITPLAQCCNGCELHSDCITCMCTYKLFFERYEYFYSVIKFIKNYSKDFCFK